VPALPDNVAQPPLQLVVQLAILVVQAVMAHHLLNVFHAKQGIFSMAHSV